MGSTTGECRMTNPDRAFGLAARQALLMLLDALESWLGLEPRTAEMRKAWKRGTIQATRKEC